MTLLVGAAFVLLLRTTSAERDSRARSLESQLVLSANRLQRLVIDLETGSRRYLLTGEVGFLQSWSAARDAVGPESVTLQQRTIVPVQDQRATQIAAMVNSYVNDYSAPLVDAAIRAIRRPVASRRQSRARIGLIKSGPSSRSSERSNTSWRRLAM